MIHKTTSTRSTEKGRGAPFFTPQEIFSGLFWPFIKIDGLRPSVGKAEPLLHRTTMNHAYLQSRKMVLLSRQDRIHDLRDHLLASWKGTSERIRLALEVELSLEIEEADGIAMEISTIEADDPIAYERSNQEIRLEELQRLHAQQGISMEYHAAVLIQLLSGETITVGIHMEQEMRTLAYEFIKQLNYPPSTMERLSFTDHKGRNILVSETWKERYGAPERIPLLYLYVHQEYEKNKEAKLAAIHSILQEKRLRSPLSQEDLWTLYHDWNLTYLPSPHSTSSSKLQEFVAAHHFVFLPLRSEEEHLDEAAKLRMWIQLRDHDSQIITARMSHHHSITEAHYSGCESTHNGIMEPRSRCSGCEFQYNREQARIHLLHGLAHYPFFTLLDESQETLHNRFILRYYFSIQELILLGMKPERISTHWWIAEWSYWSSLAERSA